MWRGPIMLEGHSISVLVHEGDENWLQYFIHDVPLSSEPSSNDDQRTLLCCTDSAPDHYFLSLVCSTDVAIKIPLTLTTVHTLTSIMTLQRKWGLIRKDDVFPMSKSPSPVSGCPCQPSLLVVVGQAVAQDVVVLNQRRQGV